MSVGDQLGLDDQPGAGPGDGYVGGLQQLREDVGDPFARAIPPHVTLMPPTEISPAQLEGFTAHLASVARQHGPFTMRLRGTGTFRPVSPVVFVQVAAGIPWCEMLEQAVRSGLRQDGLDVVRRGIVAPGQQRLPTAVHHGLLEELPVVDARGLSRRGTPAHLTLRIGQLGGDLRVHASPRHVGAHTDDQHHDQRPGPAQPRLGRHGPGPARRGQGARGRHL